jgi:hypothetical protein
MTYIGGSVALKRAVVDLHIGVPIDTSFGINRSALKVACDPPGIGAEKSGKFPRTASEVLTFPEAVLLSNALS